MSDDKKTGVIPHVYIKDDSMGFEQATAVDLEAAGYVKRELLEESERDHQSTWAKMMRQAENLTGLNASLQSTRQELIATREQLANVTAKLEAAESRARETLDMWTDERLDLKQKLEAAEGRMRELEGLERILCWLDENGSSHSGVSRRGRFTSGMRPEHLKNMAAEMGYPSPEAAKPAEPTEDWSKVEHGPFHDEPATPPPPVGRNSWALGTCKGCGGTNAALFDGAYCCKPCRKQHEGPASPPSPAVEHCINGHWFNGTLESVDSFGNCDACGERFGARYVRPCPGASPPSPAQADTAKYSTGQQVLYRWGRHAAPLLCTVQGGKRVGGYDVLGADNVLRIAHEDDLEPVNSQPPAAPGTTLTVEMMCEALREMATYDDINKAPRHIVWQKLASKLERALKGGEE